MDPRWLGKQASIILAPDRVKIEALKRQLAKEKQAAGIADAEEAVEAELQAQADAAQDATRSGCAPDDDDDDHDDGTQGTQSSSQEAKPTKAPPSKGPEGCRERQGQARQEEGLYRRVRSKPDRISRAIAADSLETEQGPPDRGRPLSLCAWKQDSDQRRQS
jgi:hypothetical protein